MKKYCKIVSCHIHLVTTNVSSDRMAFHFEVYFFVHRGRQRISYVVRLNVDCLRLHGHLTTKAHMTSQMNAQEHKHCFCCVNILSSISHQQQQYIYEFNVFRFWRMSYAGNICMHFYGYWNWIFKWFHQRFWAYVTHMACHFLDCQTQWHIFVVDLFEQSTQKMENIFQVLKYWWAIIAFN